MIDEEEVDLTNSGDLNQPPPREPTQPVEDALLEGAGGTVIEGHSLDVPTGTEGT